VSLTIYTGGMPTPYDTNPLRTLMADSEAVTGYRNQVGATIARAQEDSLDAVNNSLGLHHHVGGLGRVIASSWAIEAARAWQEIHVAMAINWRIPRTAIAEAMGLVSGNNFKKQFPQLEEILEALRRGTNTGLEITLTVRGFDFKVGPLWHGDDTAEPGQDGSN